MPEGTAGPGPRSFPAVRPGPVLGSPIGPAAALRRHLGPILRLAVPVMGARAGLVVMIAVTSMVTGHAGKDQLAFLAIAIALEIPLSTVSVGFLTGTAVHVAQARGAGRRRDWWRIWTTAMGLAVLIGAVQIAVLGEGATLLALLGQDPVLAAGGGEVLSITRWGLPALAMLLACVMALEGLGRAMPGMLIIGAGNLLNAALCAVLVFGHAGPDLPGGAEGAALAGVVTRWAMLAMAVAVLLGERRRDAPEPWPSGSTRLWAGRLCRFGVPVATSQFLESSAFMMMAMFAGWLGATAMATYQITINVLALVFMGAIGAATATAVRVGEEWGAGNRRCLSEAGGVGATVILAATAVVAVLLAVGHPLVARLYTSDPEVLAASGMALGLAALMVVPDGLQGVLAGALRGVADVAVPTGLHLISFWAVTIPAAYWLGFERGLGLRGLLLGLLVGLVVAATLLFGRIVVKARQTARGPASGAA